MDWEMPAPNWNTPAGHVLEAFLAGAHQAFPGYPLPVTLFGSAAIQICLDEAFASADVDVMVMSENASFREVAKKTGAGQSGLLRPAYGVQICPPQLFRTTPHYMQRARIEQRQGLNIVIPHVRDILIAKLHRFRGQDQQGLAAKDRRAFQRVRELCGGRPTEADVLEDLMLCASNLNITLEEGGNAFRLNTMDLFEELFQRRLDLEKEILEPVRAALPQAHLEAEEVVQRLDALTPERD
jgi:hypothetical protein